MTETFSGKLEALGTLRLGLLVFCAIDILVPMSDGLLRYGSLWSEAGRAGTHVVIASAIAPILLVVVLFDFIMSRVRAADAGEAGGRFVAIARIEGIAMAVLLAYWVPVVASLGR